MDCLPGRHRPGLPVKESSIRAVLARGLVGGRDNVEGGQKAPELEAFDAIEKWEGQSKISPSCWPPMPPTTCDDSYQRDVANRG